ncbi:MAG: hypothetical protein SFU98_01735 [Leptospiraceae bacterium]|nr:hypothetical protein [Leptospiraceae bacterium]
MKKILLLIVGISAIANCSSLGGSKSSGDSSIKVEKKSGFNATTKRVSTLSVYNLSKKKLNFKGDIALTGFANTVDAKIGNIYGDEIVGGEAISTLASKLRLSNFEKAVDNLVEVGLNGGKLSEDSKKTLSTITDKGKIDALAVPIASDTSDLLKNKGSIDLSVVIFNGKSGDVEIVGQSKGIKADKELEETLAGKPDQAIAKLNLFVIGKTSELMNQIREVVKPGSSPNQAPGEEVANAPKKEEKIYKNPGFWGFSATALLFLFLP